MKELQFIRSQRFMFYVCLFTVIALTPISYFVYYGFCQFKEPYNVIASGMAAAIIASAIMIFTFNKNEKVALVFAYFEVMVATYYYIYYVGLNWSLVPALGFAFIMPYSVKMYTNHVNTEHAEPVQPVNDTSIDQINKDHQKRIHEFMNKHPTAKPSEYGA